MNGMITTNENYDLDEVISKLKNYKVEGVVSKVTCEEKYVLEGTGKKVALLDLGAKKNIAKSLNDRGCEVTVYPADDGGIDCIRSRGYIWFEVENEKGVYNFMLYCVVYLPS